MFGTRKIPQRSLKFKLLSAAAVLAVLFTTFAWQQSASARAEGDPLRLSVFVQDESGSSVAYSGEICYRINYGGSGPFESCVYATSPISTPTITEGFIFPGPGFNWGASPSITSNTTGCSASINHQDGPTDFGLTGTWEVRYAITTACPGVPAPSPTPSPTPGPVYPIPVSGDPLDASLRVYDASGSVVALPGELCFRIVTGGSAAPIESCVYTTSRIRLEWSGHSIPPTSFDWRSSARIVSDTTGCSAVMRFEGGPSDLARTGTFQVRYGIQTFCPDAPAPTPTPTPDPSIRVHVEGEPLNISVRVSDTSGKSMDYLGEICFHIRTGGSAGPLESCLSSTTSTPKLWTGFAIPPAGTYWSNSGRITSDTTECNATIHYQGGPSDIYETGTWEVRFVIRTDCPESSTVTADPTGMTDDPTGDSRFTLLTAERACVDQRFTATWEGTGITGMEFSLTNTSDAWTCGWLVADPATGSFSAPVDHHAYDKVMARATFADGTMNQQDADVGTCGGSSIETPVVPPSEPAPENPESSGVPPGDPAPGQPVAQSNSAVHSGSGSAPVVSSLPSTGVGIGEGFVWASAIVLTVGGVVSILMLWARAIFRR